METLRLLSHLFVLAYCLIVVMGRVTSSLEETDDMDMQGSLFTQNDEMKRKDQDISKLLLKHLRFRGLPEPGMPVDAQEFAREARNQISDQVNKRHQERLVSNLAALLSGLKDRQVEPNMRMPSLRFGK